MTKKPKTKAPEASRPSRARSSARYATREEQIAEILGHVRRRDRKVYKALLVLLSADARFLTALGVLLEFVVAEATARPTSTMTMTVGRRAVRLPAGAIAWAGC